MAAECSSDEQHGTVIHDNGEEIENLPPGSCSIRDWRADAMSEAVTQTEAKRIPTPEELGFDPDALRQKYAAERTRRLRGDGNDQYQEVDGALEPFEADHYVTPGFTPPAL